MMPPSVLALLVALGLAATPAAGPTNGSGDDVAPTADHRIFVSPSGSDDGAGTSEAPLRTLAQAQRRVRALLAARQPVLEVVLRPGRYFNTSLVFNGQDSPPPGERVTWRGDGASVFGGCEITGWTPWADAPAGRPGAAAAALTRREYSLPWQFTNQKQPKAHQLYLTASC